MDENQSQSLPYSLEAGGECPKCGSFTTIFDPIYGHGVCEDCANIWAEDEDDPDYDEEFLLDLGPCCACGQATPLAQHVLMVDKFAPEPGTGWGCVICRLPLDGAIAVVCDECFKAKTPLKAVCCGYPMERRRMAWGFLKQGHFRHTMELHERSQDYGQ